MATIPSLQLPTTLKERLARGHPWVYRNHVPPHARFPTGSWVRVRCGNWSGVALWDAEGPIALRVYSEQGIPGAGWFRQRVRDAWELRAPVRDTCTAYRWLFGEGDGVPGLTVDRYGDYAVALAYSRGAATLLPQLADALRACDPMLRGIITRRRPDLDEQDSDDTRGAGASPHAGLLWGREPPDDLIVDESGLRFVANLHSGQKTGLFLDQRENRRTIETLSAGRRVLNCFAYTGGFSLYALRGAASEVVSADIGKGLAEAAATNIRLSELPAEHHTFVTEDCFALLERYAQQGRTFDLIILDPPSFAKSKQNRFAAIRAYTRLNALALRCVAPGGLLASASCTSQVAPEDFKEMLAGAAHQARRRLQIIHEAGQPRDHPVPAHFPEGRYLKFVITRAGDIA